MLEHGSKPIDSLSVSVSKALVVDNQSVVVVHASLHSEKEVMGHVEVPFKFSLIDFLGGLVPAMLVGLLLVETLPEVLVVADGRDLTDEQSSQYQFELA